MTQIEQIKDLIEFATTSKNSINKKVTIGIIDIAEANFLELKTGFNLLGFKRIIDKSAINHALTKHGNSKKENLRGQIAITKSNFELIPKIVKTENVIYAGLNKLGKECLLYEAIIGDTFYYVEEIRKGKKELCLNTLYKRKPTTKK